MVSHLFGSFTYLIVKVKSNFVVLNTNSHTICCFSRWLQSQLCVFVTISCSHDLHKSRILSKNSAHSIRTGWHVRWCNSPFKHTHRTSKKKPSGMTIKSFSGWTKGRSLGGLRLGEFLGRVAPRPWIALAKETKNQFSRLHIINLLIILKSAKPCFQTAGQGCSFSTSRAGTIAQETTTLFQGS